MGLVEDLTILRSEFEKNFSKTQQIFKIFEESIVFLEIYQNLADGEFSGFEFSSLFLFII